MLYMADMFDAIDVVYKWVSSGGITAYKDKAPAEIDEENYIVILSPKEVFSQRTTSVPLNINIYYKKTQSGMINRSEIKTLKDKVISLINEGTLPNYLFDLEQTYAYVNTTYSKTYDILVMRYDLKITAD